MDDWESANIDDLASKIASKEVKSTTPGGKPIREDEEDKEETDKAHLQKDQKHMKA